LLDLSEREGDTRFAFAGDLIRKELSTTVRTAEREALSMSLSNPSVLDPMTSVSEVDSQRRPKGGLMSAGKISHGVASDAESATLQRRDFDHSNPKFQLARDCGDAQYCWLCLLWAGG